LKKERPNTAWLPCVWERGREQQEYLSCCNLFHLPRVCVPQTLPAKQVTGQKGVCEDTDKGDGRGRTARRKLKSIDLRSFQNFVSLFFPFPCPHRHSPPDSSGTKKLSVRTQTAGMEEGTD
jgi:hypothetical protein